MPNLWWTRGSLGVADPIHDALSNLTFTTGGVCDGVTITGCPSDLLYYSALLEGCKSAGTRRTGTMTPAAEQMALLTTGGNCSRFLRATSHFVQQCGILLLEEVARRAWRASPNGLKFGAGRGKWSLLVGALRWPELQLLPHVSWRRRQKAKLRRAISWRIQRSVEPSHFYDLEASRHQICHSGTGGRGLGWPANLQLEQAVATRGAVGASVYRAARHHPSRRHCRLSSSPGAVAATDQWVEQRRRCKRTLGIDPVTEHFDTATTATGSAKFRRPRH